VSGKPLKDFDDVVKNFNDVATKCLPEFIEDLKAGAAKNPAVPNDSTVHETSSNVKKQQWSNVDGELSEEIVGL
jgi:hypothetical protein